jgi:hypothetical protein
MSTTTSTMPRIRRASVAAALGAASILCAAGGAQAALPAPVISVGSTGTLIAGGAAISIPVIVTCAEGSGAVNTQITQRRGSGLVRGEDSSSYTCDGTAQTLTMIVQPGSGVYKTGEALVTANAYLCDYDNCYYAVSDDKVVQIRR